MAVKIAVIGAGSIGFTRKLMHDILSVPELADTSNLVYQSAVARDGHDSAFIRTLGRSSSLATNRKSTD